MRLPSFFVLALTITTTGAVEVDPAKLPPPAERIIDFRKDIEPIFERACQKCHGEEKQKSGYRLDRKSSALTAGDNYAPNIHPGKSAESPLIHFVAGLDPDMKMPSKGDPLTPAEIGLLRAWIDQGAPWPEEAGKGDPLDWWSLRPLALPEVPRIHKPQSAIHNPLDAFIRAKLVEKNLAPSPEADPRTLVRRLYFDLIGLPPTPEEADEFVKACGAGDSETLNTQLLTLIDRLLASPRYGERWARHWLDVVRYGDTHGYDKDQPRPNAWPYRDYVIRSFNEDKPYARFVQEQIAGDVLFPNTRDGIEALGFIAAGPWDLIGHAEVPETKIDGQIARNLDRDDMVANTLNTFCSLTVQCARCHNHKFDPVSQEDYYGLQAVFAALDRADKTFDLDPAVAARRAELGARQRELKAKKDSLEKALARSGGRLVALLDRLIDEAGKGREATERVEFGWHSGIEAKQDVVKWVQVDLGQSREIDQIGLVACHDNFNNIGAGFGFPARYRVEISDDAEFVKNVTVLQASPSPRGADAAAAKVDEQMDFPNPGVVPVRFAANKTVRYIRVTATKLAPRMNDFIFALAELQALDASGRNVALGAAVTSLDSIEAAPRWGRANLTDGYYYGSIANLAVGQLISLKAQRDEALAKSARPELRDEAANAARNLAEIDAALSQLPPPNVAYIGTVHTGNGAFAGTGANGGKPRVIHVLHRGDVLSPKQVVGPGTVAIIAGKPSRFELPDNAPEGDRRAALARWITDEQNPLTWRSIVNRVWQYHFGRGLVDTPNDFGRMGQLPTHPELLDWLAIWFRDEAHGSLKALHRLIVTSATYRQRSDIENREAAQVDGDNRLLWRMNRRKLEAEAIRDSVLAVSGQLDLTMGGPGFQDFVVEKPEHSPHYEYALHNPDDPKSHRRSIYRFIVRSQPQPFMTVLDCADPSMSVDKRNQTITPLQALAQMNNQLILAMAKHFAARADASGADLPAKITTAFRLALARPPTPEERDALVAHGQHHGLVNVCRLILNLNEFAFVD
jgi:hypothetical protein